MRGAKQVPKSRSCSTRSWVQNPYSPKLSQYRKSAVPGHGFGHTGETAVGPVEATAFHHDAAHRGPVAPDELGRRMNHHVGSVLEGAAEVRAGEGRVDDQRYAHLVGGVGQGGHVGHDPRRVGHDLGVQRLGLGADGGGEGSRVVRSHKSGLDAEPPQADVKQAVSAAVQRRAGHDVIPCSGQGREHEQFRRLPARGGHPTDAPFEAGHALLESGYRRVGNPSVDVAVLLQGEKVGRVGDVFEHEAGGLVDRHCPGPGRRVRPVAGVDRPGPEAPLMILHQSDASRLIRPLITVNREGCSVIHAAIEARASFPRGRTPAFDTPSPGRSIRRTWEFRQNAAAVGFQRPPSRR